MSYTEPLATLSALALSTLGLGLVVCGLGLFVATWPLRWPRKCCDQMAKRPVNGHAKPSESLAAVAKGQKAKEATASNESSDGNL